MPLQESLFPGEALEAKRLLECAIDEQLPLAIVARRYAAFMVASVGTQVRAADVMGIDRRTIQRWFRRTEDEHIRAQRKKG